MWFLFLFFVKSSVRKQDFKHDENLSTAISVSHKNETSETA